MVLHAATVGAFLDNKLDLDSGQRDRRNNTKRMHSKRADLHENDLEIWVDEGNYHHRSLSMRSVLLPMVMTHVHRFLQHVMRTVNRSDAQENHPSNWCA